MSEQRSIRQFVAAALASLRLAWRRHRRLILTLVGISLFFSILGYCSGPANVGNMCLIYG